MSFTLKLGSREFIISPSNDHRDPVGSVLVVQKAEPRNILIGRFDSEDIAIRRLEEQSSLKAERI